MAEEDLTPEEAEELSKEIENADTSSSSKEDTIQKHFDEKTSISKAQFMQLEETPYEDLPASSIDRFFDVKVTIEVILGTKKLPLRNILELHQGSLVKLDKLAGEPVDLLANGKTIARGEIVIIDDYFGVKILEIVGAKQKLDILHT